MPVVLRRLWLHALEYPIARAYIDARVRRIAGGTPEIMREIIGRGLFSGGSR